MSSATAMYYTEQNPLRPVRRDSERVYIVKSDEQRRLHKAFLRYHDPNNWPLLRKALARMGRADLIGPGRDRLVPAEGALDRARRSAKDGGRGASPGRKTFATQHNGLPSFPRPRSRTPR